MKFLFLAASLLMVSCSTTYFVVPKENLATISFKGRTVTQRCEGEWLVVRGVKKRFHRPTPVSEEVIYLDEGRYVVYFTSYEEFMDSGSGECSVLESVLLPYSRNELEWHRDIEIEVKRDGEYILYMNDWKPVFEAL